MSHFLPTVEVYPLHWLYQEKQSYLLMHFDIILSE